MSVLSGQTIRTLGILTPCVDRVEVTWGEKTLTAGLGPAGYDITIDLEETALLRTGDFRLGSSVEYFTMPDNVLGVVHDKSTWARRGLCVQNTVIEPGWRGFLTLEFTNHGTSVISLKPGMPIAQVVFHFLDVPTERPYPADGKYQDQARGPQAAR
jgi:dCTP deaminase